MKNRKMNKALFSVPAAFLLGTIFLLTGLKINKRKKAEVAAKR